MVIKIKKTIIIILIKIDNNYDKEWIFWNNLFGTLSAIYTNDNDNNFDNDYDKIR